MISEHFQDLAPSCFRNPGVMECTRYCIAPGAPRTTSAALFLAVLELGLDRGWLGAYGVFDAHMVRIYRRLGTPVQIISRVGQGIDAIYLGYFEFNPALREILARRAGVERVLMEV